MPPIISSIEMVEKGEEEQKLNQTHLHRPPKIHIQRPSHILRPITPRRIQIDTGIIDQNIHNIPALTDKIPYALRAGNVKLRIPHLIARFGGLETEILTAARSGEESDGRREVGAREDLFADGAADAAVLC